jgi:hypothetical protein
MRICQTSEIACKACNFLGIGLIYFDKPTVTCPSCGSEDAYIPEKPVYGIAPGIMTDDIPGGIDIRHGLVDKDGNPRKFYSKTEIKRAANESGLVLEGDTPKPYAVRWSGKRE